MTYDRKGKYGSVVKIRFLRGRTGRFRKMSILTKLRPYADISNGNQPIVTLRKKDFDDKRNTTFAQLITIYMKRGLLEVVK